MKIIDFLHGVHPAPFDPVMYEFNLTISCVCLYFLLPTSFMYTVEIIRLAERHFSCYVLCFSGADFDKNFMCTMKELS